MIEQCRCGQRQTSGNNSALSAISVCAQVTASVLSLAARHVHTEDSTATDFYKELLAKRNTQCLGHGLPAAPSSPQATFFVALRCFCRHMNRKSKSRYAPTPAPKPTQTPAAFPALAATKPFSCPRIPYPLAIFSPYPTLLPYLLEISGLQCMPKPPLPSPPSYHFVTDIFVSIV